MHCVVCHGEIGDTGAWQVRGPGPERLAHFDCYDLALDGPPAQHACPVCGRPLDLPSVPTVRRMGRREMLRWHTHCAIYSAPSFKAAWGRN